MIAVEIFTFLDAKGYGLGTIALGKLHYYGQGELPESKDLTKELFRKAYTLGITNPGLTGELLDVCNAAKNDRDQAIGDYWDEAARRKQLN